MTPLTASSITGPEIVLKDEEIWIEAFTRTAPTNMTRKSCEQACDRKQGIVVRMSKCCQEVDTRTVGAYNRSF